MAKTTKTPQAPTHDEIAAAARRIYEMEGRPEGKAMQHWLQAEAQLIAERKPAAKAASAAPVETPARGTNWSQSSARPPVHRN